MIKNIIIGASGAVLATVVLLGFKYGLEYVVKQKVDTKVNEYVEVKLKEHEEKVNQTVEIRLAKQRKEVATDFEAASLKQLTALRDTVSLYIPAGTIVAFESQECPNEHWEKYKKAYGRFIRGMDKSGERIDPQGEQAAGTPQEDMIVQHQHILGRIDVTMDTVDSNGNHYGVVSGPGSDSGNVKAGNVNIGNETRPKNVALLYCIKK